MNTKRIMIFPLGCTLATTIPAFAETVWIEAEHLDGVHGYCFPDMEQKTAGHWALSGPGICPEWTQGGESEWLSIACSPEDDRASASIEFEAPVAGEYKLWARYRDWRGQSEIFRVRVEQGGKEREFTFGEKTIVDDNEELKLLWKWAFAWDSRAVKLDKGAATLTLLSAAKQAGHRQLDAFCLTTDATYRPFYREKPTHPTWKVLDELRANPVVSPKPLAARAPKPEVPDAWKVRTFRDQGFVYLWNMNTWKDDLASDGPKRMLVPYQTEPAQTNAFREMFGGKIDVPIFGDPRIAPAWHGAGPHILDYEPFVKWLEANPARLWGNMMNYWYDLKPVSDTAKANWARYKDRYVGNIAGENLGYFDQQYEREHLRELLRKAKSREEVLRVCAETFLKANAAKQQAIFGGAVENPYQYTIPCQSTEMLAYAHACREWGARTVGYESTSVAPSLAMRMAFLRGSARQYGGLSATYRSSNFGDAATIFSTQSTYPGPRYVYDNSYDVWAGAGMTWYKFDIWHEYMSGASMFYHEQGFDEFWTPQGGATPRKPLQLSPKGRLVEQFLQLTQRHPDRGAPFTPIAFLLDHAHGWDPTANQPAYFGHEPALNPSVLKFGLHAKMLKEWFKVAYHPYGPKESEVVTAVNQIHIPGVFGNVFDVLVTGSKRDAIAAYPVVVLVGEVTVDEAWGKKLAEFMNHGGTLVVSAGQLRGPGVAALKLPKTGSKAEADKCTWLPTQTEIASNQFRYQPIAEGAPLAQAGDDVIAVTLDRGKGRLIFLSVPLGLGVDTRATPLVALTLAGVRQGLLPVEVEGEVEWLLNRTAKGWIVTLLNPGGSNKPQHGVVPTDHTQSRAVKIRGEAKWSKATEWFEEAALKVETVQQGSTVEITVPAGGVRIVEIQ